MLRYAVVVQDSFEPADGLLDPLLLISRDRAGMILKLQDGSPDPCLELCKRCWKKASHWKLSIAACGSD
ncbi:hypothetical protein N826_06110 [Skermanella aerolata KACC 11604]|nr:hypothetical protein N826_06110 [Skermanella aerolata KACC 11604]